MDVAAPRPITAYVPKHAASDFSQMNLPTKIYRDDPLIRSRRNSLQAGDPLSVRPAVFEPNEDSTDYQNFLAESPAAEARTYRSRPILPSLKTTTPQVSQIMNEITANHHASMREPARSISQRSATSKPVSRGGNIFDRVGEYIKPSRPESVYSQRTGYTSFLGDDKSSFKGSVYVPEAQEADGQEGKI